MGSCCCTAPQHQPPEHRNKPLVRMCSSGNHFPNFADIGDKIVLFVDFGNNFKPLPRRNRDHSLGGATAGLQWPDQRHHGEENTQYEIKFAGLQAFLKRIKPKEENCTSYRSEVKLLMTDDILREPGGLVKFTIPYCDSEGQYLGVVTEQDHEYDASHRVYNHPIWDELIVHNGEIRDDIQCRTSTRLVEGTYGSMARRRARESAVIEGPTDQVDAEAGTSGSQEYLSATHELDPLLGQPPRAKRYWPDSWEMSCWRPCCDPILRSENWFTRFLAMFFVAPLTNVTGLSLYYQLYLVEIFHLRFKTKLGHYLFMPLIVMMMLCFFAQWRFDHDCYTLANTEVLVWNGAAVFAFFLLFWYCLWGLIQRTPCMGFFMIVPLAVMYILANITFQMAVKNSALQSLNCETCWNHTNHLSNHVKYYNAFQLMHWYFNPVLWTLVLCLCQAISHSFEPKIPPRVNQTNHWMSCDIICKTYGFPKTLLIFMAQAIFGTIDELLASPRLLPLLILRICFTLGYSPKEWKVLKILVKKSLQYGDPALDYIGTGGADYLPKDSVIPEVSLSTTGTSGEALENNYNIGYNIRKLKKTLQEMESTLTDSQRKILTDPRTIRYCDDDWLKHYIVLRHYVAKYELQVHAYGPFRSGKENKEALHDDVRMDRDFPLAKHSSFRNFLQQVRFHLWLMEDEFITKRAISACCAKEI